MKFLLCAATMTLLGLTGAGRIPRSFDALQVHNTHNNFPNLHTVHHGHGATSYQNVDIENHGDVQIPTKFRAEQQQYYGYPKHDDNHELYEVSAITTVPRFPSTNGIPNHYYQLSDDSDLYDSNNIDHIEINNIAEQSAYYDNYDHEYDFGYQ
ncbi:uncharacterized protein LOC125502287 [Athalia rosae]|uniref:uncharacterized protein LOC125502287 n=1 Tax=Athalia rosae TaxID=37344 RepID=UPI002033A22E|nr:uncharacterized protein LOC125502287 [Athalia rosae]